MISVLRSVPDSLWKLGIRWNVW